jgi:hypothetical protein
MLRARRQSENIRASCLPARTFIVACSTLMDGELEKLVEANKLTSKAAEKLDALKPGAFCLHKSWGFGRVAEWNILLNQILIDFTGKKCHPMQLQYAAENRQGRSGRGCPEYFGKPRRKRDPATDQRVDGSRPFQ